MRSSLCVSLLGLTASLHLSLSCTCSACHSISIIIWCTSAQLGGYFNISYLNISVNLVTINFEGETFVDFADF